LLLQWLYDLTDREVEWAMKNNAAYQLFCGCCIVEDWHAPDPTKMEAFRSRLSPETQRQMANQVAVWATEHGFADPSKMDLDAAIPGQHLSALISMRYIFSFREGKSIFFNGLDQNCSV
jgi:transposase, IS5 family